MKTLHRLAEGGRVDPESLPERFRALGPGDVTRAHMRAESSRRRRRRAKTVTPDGAVVGDQEHFDALIRGARLDHRLDEIVIGIRLVDESLATTVYGNDSRLAPIDEVRKRLLATVGLRYRGHRRPGGGKRSVLREGRTDGPCHAKCHHRCLVAGGQRVVVLAFAHVRVQA